MLRKLGIVAALSVAAPAAAVNVVIDYTYASSFFSESTTNGQQARATVEAAAAYLTELLDDDLVSMQKPDNYISSAPGGADAITSWSWSALFTNPSSGGQTSISNPTFFEDEYRVFVGARNLPGTTLGEAGPGGASWNASISYYFQWQLDEINQISDDFSALLDNRSQSAGDFGSWGGSVTFDTSTNWHYDHTTLPPSSTYNDLYSVALHELFHTVGWGISDEWNALVSGSRFTGAASTAANGGTSPAVAPGHWADGTMSTVYGASTTQEALMDPDITSGTRKEVTTLDTAALTDLGWEIILPGDYNSTGTVDAADYTIWRDSLGSGSVTGNYGVWSSNYGASTVSTSLSIPEPSGLTILLAALVFGTARRRR